MWTHRRFGLAMLATWLWIVMIVLAFAASGCGEGHRTKRCIEMWPLQRTYTTPKDHNVVWAEYWTPSGNIAIQIPLEQPATNPLTVVVTINTYVTCQEEGR